MAELERELGVPAVEAYGMTEAAHQISSNPLPPGERKAGSVGLPAGPEIVVLDDAGREVAGGVEGEIAIRGPNVIDAYVGDAPASDRATPEGWLRTGDAGRFDSDGYLSITGRLKEIINRGGEKIAPCEIEEVLGDHPAVEGAVVFACPHDRLGEEVAAAVVLRDQTTIGEAELRTHVGTRLAAFKVPHAHRARRGAAEGPDRQAPTHRARGAVGSRRRSVSVRALLNWSDRCNWSECAVVAGYDVGTPERAQSTS